jgi:SAM-dependent methyltransferase
MSAGEGWSDVAAVWAESWGPASRPVHDRLVDVLDAGPGSRVLDVGCGTGEMLATLVARGARAAGVDPAVGMVGLSRRNAPAADVREGSWERLPWSDAAFDAVTAVNALQFADDTLGALSEARRVVRAGGLVAIANWAERAFCDLETIDAALAESDGDEPAPDGDLRLPGGIEAVLRDAGFRIEEVGTVDAPWELRDERALLRAVLLDDAASDDVASYRNVVLAAAERFRRKDGRYILRNTFRYAVARVGGPESVTTTDDGGLA